MRRLRELAAVVVLTATGCTWDSELAAVTKPRRVVLVQHNEVVPGMGSSSENVYLVTPGYERTLLGCVDKRTPALLLSPDGKRAAVRCDEEYWKIYWFLPGGELREAPLKGPRPSLRWEDVPVEPPPKTRF